MHWARIEADDVAKPVPDLKTKFHVGCSGWFYWDWRGEFYPQDMPTHKWYLHDYSKEELMIWVEQIKQTNPKRIWAYFNNDYDCYSIKNAKQFLKLLKSSL